MRDWLREWHEEQGRGDIIAVPDEFEDSVETRRGPGRPKGSGPLQKKTEEERRQRRIYEATYRNKNKAKLNRKRRLRDSAPPGAYRKAVRRAKYKKQPWNLTMEEWFGLWDEAPDVIDPDRGFLVRPWAVRGSNPYRNSQMQRVDQDGPWEVGNAGITFAGRWISGPLKGEPTDLAGSAYTDKSG